MFSLINENVVSAAWMLRTADRKKKIINEKLETVRLDEFSPSR